METLASVWARDPCDLSDLDEKTAWDSPPVGLMWAEQLSPHLQRNKQLQDTLLQREEELARLQEENNKLREFLNSSFVRNLEQKAKKLRADGRRTLKRNLMHPDDGPLQNHHQQVNKRVCRNLTAEFCSESSETSPSSEPNLDLWVLRTLGLKDRDTIDTSSDSSCSSSPGFSLSSSVYDAAVTSSSSSNCALNSSFGPVVTSTPSSVRSCSTHQPDYRFSPAESPQICRRSPGSDFSAAGLTGPYEAPEAVIRSFNMLPALTEEPALTPSPHPAETRPISQGHQDKHPVYWTPPQDRIQISPAADRALHSPTSSLSPAMNRLWTPMSPSAGSQPQTPRTPRSRSDLAFSMSLSPSSSVKTHSFPQGQAFVRKDPEGRWNFTWVPRQGP